MEFEFVFFKKFRNYFTVKIIKIENTYLTFKLLYILNNIICFCLIHGKIIAVHSELFYHFGKCVYRKSIMLRGNAETFLDFTARYIFVFNQFVLRNNLLGISDKFFPFGRQTNPAIGTDKNINADFLFKFADCSRNRRLRNKQFLGRFIHRRA